MAHLDSMTLPAALASEHYGSASAIILDWRRKLRVACRDQEAMEPNILLKTSQGRTGSDIPNDPRGAHRRERRCQKPALASIKAAGRWSSVIVIDA